MPAERSATGTPDCPPTGKPPPAVSPAARERFGEARWETWSTSVVLRLSDPRGLGAARVAVERELDAIDRACSRFRADSEIARVNASAGSAVRVSPLLAEALALALRAARLTDGDVDPTVGSALTLAGYDRDWPLLRSRRAACRSPMTAARASAPLRRRSWHARSAAGAAWRSTAPRARCAYPPVSRSTSARPPKPGRPTAPHGRPRRPPAAARWSRSAATSPPAVPRRHAAGPCM